MVSGIPSSRKILEFPAFPPTSCFTVVFMVPLKTFANICNFQLLGPELVSRKLLSISKAHDSKQLILLSVDATVILDKSHHPASFHFRKS